MDSSLRPQAVFRDQLRQFQSALQDPTATKGTILTTLRGPLAYFRPGPQNTNDGGSPFAHIDLRFRMYFILYYYTGFLQCILDQVPRRGWLAQLAPTEISQVWRPWFGINLYGGSESKTSPLPTSLVPGLEDGSCLAYVAVTRLQAIRALVAHLSARPPGDPANHATPTLTLGGDDPLPVSVSTSTSPSTNPTRIIHSATLEAIHELLLLHLTPNYLDALFEATQLLSQAELTHPRSYRASSSVPSVTTAQPCSPERQNQAIVSQWNLTITCLFGIPLRVANCMDRTAINRRLQAAPYYRDLNRQVFEWIIRLSSSVNQGPGAKADHEGQVSALQALMAKLGSTKQFRELAAACFTSIDEASESGPFVRFLAHLLGRLDLIHMERFLQALLDHVWHTHLKWCPANVSRCAWVLKQILAPLSTQPGGPLTEDDASNPSLLFDNKYQSRLIDWDEICSALIHSFILRGPVKTNLLKVLVSLVFTLAPNESIRDQSGDTLLNAVMDRWGNPTFLTDTPTETLKSTIEVFLLSISYTSSERLAKITRTPAMMHGIQRFLEYPVEDLRNLGLVVAESISKKIDPATNRLDFGMDGQDPTVRRLRELSTFQLESPVPPLIKAAGIRSSDQPSILQMESDQADDSRSVSSELTSTTVGEPLDSGLQPYPQMAPRRMIPHTTVVNPKKDSSNFIRDCLSYLEATDDPRRFGLGLETAQRCISQADPLDLEHLSTSLTLRLLGMQDHYRTENFAQKRHDALVEIMLRLPKLVVPIVINEFFERNYNLDQRNAMLAAIAHTSGRISDINYDQDKLKVQQTITQLQQTEERISSNSNPLQIVPSRPLASLLPNSTTATPGLGPGRVTRYSRRLELAKAHPTASSTSRRNPYLALAGPTFFFPLLGGVYSRTSYFNVAQDSPLIFEKFIRTLNALFYATGGAALHIVKMAREYWDFCRPLLLQAQRNLRVQAQANSNSKPTPGKTQGIATGLLSGPLGPGDGADLDDAHSHQVLDTLLWPESSGLLTADQWHTLLPLAMSFQTDASIYLALKTQARIQLFNRQLSHTPLSDPQIDLDWYLSDVRPQAQKWMDRLRFVDWQRLTFSTVAELFPCSMLLRPYSGVPAMVDQLMHIWDYVQGHNSQILLLSAAHTALFYDQVVRLLTEPLSSLYPPARTTTPTSSRSSTSAHSGHLSLSDHHPAVGSGSQSEEKHILNLWLTHLVAGAVADDSLSPGLATFLDRISVDDPNLGEYRWLAYLLAIEMAPQSTNANDVTWDHASDSDSDSDDLANSELFKQLAQFWLQPLTDGKDHVQWRLEECAQYYGFSRAARHLREWTQAVATTRGYSAFIHSDIREHCSTALFHINHIEVKPQQLGIPVDPEFLETHYPGLEFAYLE
ncbi:hypothetical protein BJ085DRAFT_34826 [Dimargaris cristalligena]|uniref:Telomere length regulation protein conserved domain-containing protein n=1 Tax=Dimargaris cristalligena TaxID=215637 RepID=A0A4P9ZPR4_9FUNG|nr:hypothetical protein BJ085DRAFT_34826 [Dimargaris cristalligena]|eukprot:RKP34592.1 hypothetical protein BJ085DRAFT_34826 [Dimargaris cristalligena]